VIFSLLQLHFADAASEIFFSPMRVGVKFEEISLTIFDRTTHVNYAEKIKKKMMKFYFLFFLFF
jgi:hypothetical protein